MAIFDKLIKKAIERISGEKGYNYLPDKDIYFNILSDEERIKIRTESESEVLEAYYHTPQLASIVNYISKVFSRNDLRYYNANGEESDHEFLTILDNPHPLYSEGEFWETFAKQFVLHNIVLLYKVRGIGTPISGLFILPFDLMKIIPVKGLKPIDILLAKDLNELIDHYTIKYDNVKYKIPVEDVWFMTGSSLRFDGGGFLVPDNIVETLKLPLENIQANYQARFALTTKRGALGLWVNNNRSDAGVIPMTSEEKKEARREFTRAFGVKSGQDIIGITNQDLRFENSSIPLKDLELSQAITDDKIALCDAFNFPLLLLNELEGSTFSNLNIAERLLYTNNIIPFWELVAKSLTREFIDVGYLEFYSDNIESLKKDDKTEAETNEINTRIIRDLNGSISLGQMTVDTAVNTLTSILDFDEQTARTLINDNTIQNEL